MSAAQHIEWLNLVEKTGPFLAVGVLEEAFPQGLEKVETRKCQRIRSAYEEWRDAVDSEEAQLGELHREWIRLILEEMLEFESSALKPTDKLPATLVYREPLTGAEVKPDFAVLSRDKSRLLISGFAPDVELTAPLAGESWTASPIERMTMLCRATGVRIGLVTNGECWTIVSVPADGSSSLGTWFARIWQQEPVTLQAFVSLLGVRRCFGPTEGTLENIFALSLEHQNEVTDTLGEQVRRAVEVLVQALDRADLDRDRQLLKDVTPAQLYEAGLTFMMRLVVLLCAEERKLLLLGEPIYDQNYAVSTLRSRLREDKERLGDEVLERRHDAWARLLAVFRAVFGGIENETLRLPPLGGSLFDPDRFPFLEGRATGTSWRDTPAVPLPIDNRTVLMLLTALQVLEQRTGALLLSYEALDVEQIGHVYEGLLERTVKRVPETTLGLIGSQKAINPNLPLRELEETKSRGDDKLLAFLLEKTGRSEAGLRNALTKKVDDLLYHRVLLACGEDVALTDRLKPFAHLLRTDSWEAPLVYRENSFTVTMGVGRRETGTHYTPKSLTEPIVQHSLQPLVYVGPSEGKPQNEWRLKSPAEILALKICDMAVGSAAFLVQTSRWLGDRLVEAWDVAERSGRFIAIEGEVLESAGDAELLPRDKAERVLIARRLIVNRCLYGVDRNPMALELAKVSLWLVTMMKGRPFSFLDHALKCGDSLLGISSLKQIENFSLRCGERQVTFATSNLFRYIEEADRKRRELEDLPSNDYPQIETKSRLNAEAETATAKVKALADCLIGFELCSFDGQQYEEQRAIAADHAEVMMRKTIEELQIYSRQQLHGRRAFHWRVEFPEVFAGGGFDGFIGNPPFVTGTAISTYLGVDYKQYLKRVWPHLEGRADLCVIFMLRAASLCRNAGVLGFIGSNTTSETDSRISGPAYLLANGFSIYRAVKSMPWPGSAAVFVCQVHFFHGTWAGRFELDGKQVTGIDSSFTESREMPEPFTLSISKEMSFTGTKVYGNGFVLTADEADRICRDEPKCREVIKPYLIGKELNEDPACRPARFIIDFTGFSEARAKEYTSAWSILEERVKQERQSAPEKRMREIWWQFQRPRNELYAKLRHTGFAWLVAATSDTLAFVGIPYSQEQPIVFSHAVNILTLRGFGDFALVQGSLHLTWARRYGSSLKGDFRYTTTDCFENFPMPMSTAIADNQGRRYHDLRSEIMQARREGLTTTYDRFHNREEKSEDIARLRALLIEMDQAVAATYGWRDLNLGHGFHETKQGVRYTLSEYARRTVLERLLKLNHQRYEEEVKTGLHDKKGKKPTGRANRSRKSKAESATLELL